MLASEFFDRFDTFFDRSRQPVAPRLIRIAHFPLGHNAFDRGHGPSLPARRVAPVGLEVVAVDVGVAGFEAEALIQTVGRFARRA